MKTQVRKKMKSVIKISLKEKKQQKKMLILDTNILGKNNNVIENNIIENKVENVENEEIENKHGNIEGKISKIFNDEIREGIEEFNKIIYST